MSTCVVVAIIDVFNAPDESRLYLFSLLSNNGWHGLDSFPFVRKKTYYSDSSEASAALEISDNSDEYDLKSLYGISASVAGAEADAQGNLLEAAALSGIRQMRWQLVAAQTPLSDPTDFCHE